MAGLSVSRGRSVERTSRHIFNRYPEIPVLDGKGSRPKGMPKGSGKGGTPAARPLEWHLQSFCCFHNCERCRRYELDRWFSLSPLPLCRCVGCGHTFIAELQVHEPLGWVRHMDFPCPSYLRCNTCLLELFAAPRRKSIVVTARANDDMVISCTLMNGKELCSAKGPITHRGLRELKAKLSAQLPEILEDQPRLAIDGEFYVWEEFLAYYGPAAHKVWQEAAGRTAEIVLVTEGVEVNP